MVTGPLEKVAPYQPLGEKWIWFVLGTIYKVQARADSPRMLFVTEYQNKSSRCVDIHSIFAEVKITLEFYYKQIVRNTYKHRLFHKRQKMLPNELNDQLKQRTNTIFLFFHVTKFLIKKIYENNGPFKKYAKYKTISKRQPLCRFDTNEILAFVPNTTFQ